MIIDTSYYEGKLEELKRYHPYLIGHIKKVRPRGEGGIRVTLDDGTQYDYISSAIGIRRVVSYNPSDVDEISEDTSRKLLVYRLTDLMEQNGFSQQILAERAGLSKGAVNKYVNGLASPTSTALRRMAYALGVTVGELLD